MTSQLHNWAKALLVVPLLAIGVAAFVPTSPVMAGNCNTSSATLGVNSGAQCAKSTDQKGDIGNIFEAITNVLLFIIGAISVIMIIIGGIRYTISNGDSAQISSAKNTILYAVIGLIVALLAFAIVNFVIDSFVKKPTDTSAILRMTS